MAQARSIARGTVGQRGRAGMSKAYSIGPDGKLVFDKDVYAEEERQRLEKLRAMTDEELHQRLDLFAMADDHDWEWREFMNESERRRKERKP